MKVTAFNGSPRKNGNTSILLKNVLSDLEQQGIETEYVQIGGKLVHGCTACGKCKGNPKIRCVIENDFVNDCIGKMLESDGIIFGSPVYFADITTELKALMDRAGYVLRGNGALLKRKVGAGVISVRRGGAVTTFDTMNRFFLVNSMIVPGSTYWNFAIGRNPGDVLEDEEGMSTMKELANNMAWLLEKLDK